MTFTLDPADYEMRKNPPKEEAAQSHSNASYDIDKEFLEGMSHEDLKALTWRLLCQCGLAATMTEEQTAQAMLDTLAETALKPVKIGVNMRADIQSRLNAIDKWLDRTQGKAVQRIDQRLQTIHHTAPAQMTTAQIMEALAKIEDTKLIEGTAQAID